VDGRKLEERLVRGGVTGDIIRCAIQVHRTLGPGLLESVYKKRLALELAGAGLSFLVEAEIPIVYKGVRIDGVFKADMIVEEGVVLELKAVEALSPIHEAQLLTYLRLSKHRVGLLMNFNAPTLVAGLRRFVL
jgi:GxxExxY protein